MKLKKLSALLAAGLLCLTAVTGCSQTPAAPEKEATPTPSSDVTTMRVATWNIDSKAHPDIKEMSNIIHERGIEIMGFQEIDILNTRNDYDMAQDFVNDNYPYVHFAKGRDFADGYFGVGTTSSLEFQESRLLSMSRIPAGKTTICAAVSSRKSSNVWLPIRFRTRFWLRTSTPTRACMNTTSSRTTTTFPTGRTASGLIRSTALTIR